MFSKKQDQRSQASNPPRPAARAVGSSTFSVIGPDVIIRGNIEASADLHVDGKVIGDIACASLVMGDASSVEGQIVAESARISGAVSGTIRVRELVVLRGASVEGDVSYETISIEQGAAVNGRFAPRSAGQAASPAISQTGASALIEDAEFIAAG
jgi:cytoskeletal protein CcmA (bactofilin family)